jgi:hypothetical protein
MEKRFAVQDRVSKIQSNEYKLLPSYNSSKPRLRIWKFSAIGEFDFRLAVGVMEGDDLRKSLFEDHPNFGYRSNRTLIDELVESGAFNVAHVRVGVKCGVIHNYFLEFSPIKLLLTSVISLLF